MSQRYLLVANPTAQSGRAAERINAARKGLADMQREVTLLPTEPLGRTVGKVTEALDAGEFDCVIAMGGDGTFSEVAQGLLASTAKVPMGLLPAGTANDQGKSFGISAAESALATNLETLTLGHVVNIDVGRCQRIDESGQTNAECLFFDSVGWGMQAEILETRNRDRELVDQIPLIREVYRDQAVYFGAALNRYLASWVAPTKFTLQLVADGSKRTYEGMTDVIINATPIYAANWVLDRDARADDGVFEIVPIQGRRDWVMKMLKDLTQVQEVISLEEQFDALGLGYTPGFSAASFDLLLDRPERPAVASQVDGEVWLEGRRFRVEVDPGRLPLIVPKAFVPPWRR